VPEIFRFRNIRFFFYSRDHKPIHVHIKHAENSVVINVDTLEVRDNHGFSTRELNLLKAKVSEHADLIKEMWNEHFEKE
jgi:uncharacterized protein YpmS